MKMLVRTENGRRLLEIDAEEFRIDAPVYLPHHAQEYTLWADDICLAHYVSRQAAIRQLDDIQEWLEKKHMQNAFGSEPVYDLRTRKVKGVDECTSESTPVSPVQVS